MFASSHRWPIRRLGAAALSAVAWTAAAQPPVAATRRADPLDAAASVPAVVHESVIVRQRRVADVQAIPWRESNDTAARIGGWRAYAREAQQAEPAPPAPAAIPGKPDAQAQPMPKGHGGHKMP